MKRLRARERIKQEKLLRAAAQETAKSIFAAAADRDQFRRYIVKKKENYQKGAGELSSREWEEEIVCEKLDTKSLRDFTAALSELCDISESLYGGEGGMDNNSITVSFSDEAQEYSK